MPSDTLASLPFHEPPIATILVQSSLLICLNVVNAILDNVLYCGLVGQILLGIAWGTPGANWLSSNVERAIVQLGYLGLLLLVYEGGLSTSLKAVKANLSISVAVALTGISLPIGLSFVLKQLTCATYLQCFAAGASLSSTSLGTTFTVLGTSGLTTSRLGVVLSSAAIMDDVIGLVLVQVIANFGREGNSLSAPVVLRPLLVSIALALFAPCVCFVLVKPATKWLNISRARCSLISDIIGLERTALAAHVSILLCCVAGASYAGASNLLAAYIAGASIAWWDNDVEHREGDTAGPEAASSMNHGDAVETSHRRGNAESSDDRAESASIRPRADLSGSHIYRNFFHQPVTRILRPFFFASIGFSIPISNMFARDIVWKGLVYAALMCLAKLACGIWLIRLSVPRVAVRSGTRRWFRERVSLGLNHFWTLATPDGGSRHNANRAAAPSSSPDGTEASPEQQQTAACSANTPSDASHTGPSTIKPRSVYPASIIGCAMVARGEIGFLISSVAEGNGVFGQSSDAAASSPLFLIVTWAIVICTIIGPLAVGSIVQRVKRLQSGVQTEGGTVHRDVLGRWGLS